MMLPFTDGTLHGLCIETIFRCSVGVGAPVYHCSRPEKPLGIPKILKISQAHTITWQ